MKKFVVERKDLIIVMAAIVVTNFHLMAIGKRTDSSDWTGAQSLDGFVVEPQTLAPPVSPTPPAPLPPLISPTEPVTEASPESIPVPGEDPEVKPDPETPSIRSILQDFRDTRERLAVEREAAPVVEEPVETPPETEQEAAPKPAKKPNRSIRDRLRRGNPGR